MPLKTDDCFRGCMGGIVPLSQQVTKLSLKWVEMDKKTMRIEIANKPSFQ